MVIVVVSSTVAGIVVDESVVSVDSDVEVESVLRENVWLVEDEIGKDDVSVVSGGGVAEEEEEVKEDETPEAMLVA